MAVSTISVLGRNIYRYRRGLGFSQFELARRSGVIQGTISQLESGKQQDVFVRHALALARALDVSVEELMEGRGEA